MPELKAQRKLVKSPPELWNEVSDVEALARHLGEFGEIRISRLEPETTVVWESEVASGVVKLSPAGWGTQVTITAELAEAEPPPASPDEPRFLDRFLGRWRAYAAMREGLAVQPPRPSAPPRYEVPVEQPPPTPEEPPLEAPPAEEPPLESPPIEEPVPEAPPDSEPPDPAALDAARSQAVLEDMLEHLGTAHHRPFSRG
jgi:hypothetical protein